ncbi:hypothetical protein DBV15_08738 [Temnothorax longispinosus]|uniref:Uncharacterized protein n=1 Tax=Temnothorax longispinosus TaxID=300112 RepID=A0A4S2KPZ6_9HYME|nr:hypothetical protein DBV15_08738 [Temnothorax longispinosus]
MRPDARNRLAHALTRRRWPSLFGQARGYASPSQTRRVNARPPVASAKAGRGRGRDYATADDCARGEFRRAGHGHLPPTFTLWEIHRHGPNNPTASVRTSKWTTSIIPPRHDSKDANIGARAACDCHHRSSAVYSW